MKFKISVLSPVHIGSGNIISPLEYFVKNKKFVRIDMDGLFKDPIFKSQAQQFIEKAIYCRLISKVLPAGIYERHILYTIAIHPSAERSNLIEVKEYIKSAGRVFIPGSSIKGSILSGVMENVLKQKGSVDFRNYNLLLGNVLNEISGGNKGKFSRWIDIRDTDFKKCEESLMLVQSRVAGAKTGRTLPILYEALMPGIEFETEIVWSAARKQEKAEINILSMADKFYRKIYQKEAQSGTVKMPSVPQNSFLLRIGQGSSAWATSFLLLAEELGIRNYDIKRPPFHKVKGPPTTKKLISGSISMGWVAIKQG
ncbi:MAG: type III-A CRISPR-associated RAMP protein Csm5 [Candidatus Omnitrophica bacterium]|nr:type III-A CRISPR-associated RAMP protein Csm5 [Candidatus Omnitrophota bacterium]MCM8827661.1 type III-A CRISPR-associated RAMP protein Csm5 [Candidatus Omnitrophota bacterium]